MWFLASVQTLEFNSHPAVTGLKLEPSGRLRREASLPVFVKVGVSVEVAGVDELWGESAPIQSWGQSQHAPRVMVFRGDEKRSRETRVVGQEGKDPRGAGLHRRLGQRWSEATGWRVRRGRENCRFSVGVPVALPQAVPAVVCSGLEAGQTWSLPLPLSSARTPSPPDLACFCFLSCAFQ